MRPDALAVYASFALVLAAAVWDIRTRRIPNFLTYPAVLLGFVFPLVRGNPAALLPAALGLLAGFLLLLVPYLLRAMGAGDLKLMAALGALLGPRAIFSVFLYSTIAGGLVALMVLAFRGELWMGLRSLGRLLAGLARGSLAPGSGSEKSRWVPIGKIPYGVAIAMGTVFALIPAVR
jgi:prepilin peptidase CpaA